jgi:hypothetical protein
MSKYPLRDALEEKQTGVKWDLTFMAIEVLRDAEKIRQYEREYIEWMRENASTEEIRRDAERVARSNIGYILGYYGKKEQKRWFDALPEVSHPIFGRRLDVTPKEAFKTGKKMAEAMRKEVSDEALGH